MEKIQLQDLSKEQLIEFINTLSLELQNANLKILKYEEQLRHYK